MRTSRSRSGNRFWWESAFQEANHEQPLRYSNVRPGDRPRGDARGVPAFRALGWMAPACDLQARPPQYPAAEGPDDPDRRGPDAEHNDHLGRARYGRHA